jgi:SAM-dependent methyltransferase
MFDLLKKKKSVALPPAELRFRVGGSHEANEFLKVGERCANDLRAALKRIKCEFAECSAVLDFGCGSGRTLRWFTENRQRFFGSDIDVEAIKWCKANLRGMTFTMNGSVPPLEFNTNQFDLIYAVSVFSHLDENYARLWLDELRRVAKFGGILALSIHGPPIYQATGRDVADLHKSGFIFNQSGFWTDRFPDWYGEMCYDQTGARRFFGRDLDFLCYIAAGINAHQDLILLRKP